MNNERLVKLRRAHRLCWFLSAALLPNLIAADVCSALTYTFDGHCNNPTNPSWGSAGSEFLRLQVPSNFSDSDFEGNRHYGPRELSLNLTKRAENEPAYPGKQTTDFTSMLSYFGQFIAHEMMWTVESSLSAPIAVPRCDPYMDADCTGNRSLPFHLAVAAPGRINSSNSSNPSPTVSSSTRGSINANTAFIDGSTIYGSSAATCSALREGVGGRMKTGDDNGLPLNTMGLPMIDQLNILPPERLRAAGDMRANQNPGLLALHTLFLREHNARAEAAARAHPDWSDQELFQEARKWVVAQLQAILYMEYVPMLGIQLPKYRGYDPAVQPGVDLFFSAVAFRYGHSTLTDTLLRIDDNANEVAEGHLQLLSSFFNPEVSLAAGVEALLRGLTATRAGKLEPSYSATAQQHMFGFPGGRNQDLLSLDIQRARSLGIPMYNAARAAFGLPRAVRWADVTPSAELAARLAGSYGVPDLCDALVCGLAEQALPNSHFGPLLLASVADQYRRTRDGDRLFFENAESGLFNETEIVSLRRTTLSQLIRSNTDVATLPRDVWRLDVNSPWYSLATCNATARVPGQGLSNMTLWRGDYVLSWEFEQRDGKPAVVFDILAHGTGWVGLGIARGPNERMLSADLYLARVDGVTGAAELWDCWSDGPQAPVNDTAFMGETSATLVSAWQRNGWTHVQFWRLLDTGDPWDHVISPLGPSNMLLSYHPTSSDFATYHGPVLRQQAAVNFYAGTIDMGASPVRSALVAHGVCMMLAFLFVFQLGSLAARFMHARIARRLGTKVQLFYAHMALQCVGVVLATAGMIVAVTQTSWDYVTPDSPLYAHRTTGIVAMAMVYTQLLLGLVRPPPNPKRNQWLRRTWEMTHHMLGWATLILGVFNTFFGIYSATAAGRSMSLQAWAVASWFLILIVTVVMAALDRMERQAVARELQALQGLDGRSDGSVGGGGAGGHGSLLLVPPAAATPSGSGSGSKHPSPHMGPNGGFQWSPSLNQQPGQQQGHAPGQLQGAQAPNGAGGTVGLSTARPQPSAVHRTSTAALDGAGVRV